MEFPDKFQNKSALFIVNTYLLPNALNDVLNYFLLCQSWGIDSNKMTILIDRPVNYLDQRLSALKGFGVNVVPNSGRDFVARYRDVLKSINDSSKGSPTSLFISISGHGSQIRDRNGDEPDGFDESIFPNGFSVLDDDLNNGLLILNENFYVLTATDTCHSGTMFDLKYNNQDSISQNDKTRTLKCLVFSLSACADKEVDWEVGSASSKLERYIPKIDTLQGKSFLNILRRNTITGALTAGLVSTGIGKVNDDTIQQLSSFLQELGQKCVRSSTVPLEQVQSFANKILINDIKRNKVTRNNDTDETEETNNDDENNNSLLIAIFIIVIILVLAIIFYICRRQWAPTRRNKM